MSARTVSTGHDGGPVRLGVLGASSVARRRTLPAVAAAPNVVLTAIASRDKGKAARMAGEFGCVAAADYDAVLASADVDAVYLPLPAALHHRWALAALAAGKHVLVEKPMATTAAETSELLDAAARRGLVIRQNLTYPHHRQHATVRDLVEAGRIGPLMEFHSAFCIPPLPASDIRHRAELGGGALLDVGVYPISAARFFLGDELEVAGAVLRWDAEYDVDMGGAVLLRSGDGRTATLSFGFEHGYGARYLLWGGSGRISVDRAFTPPAWLAPVVRIEEQDHVEEIVLPSDHQFRNSLSAFAEAVLDARSTGADPERAVQAASALGLAELLARIGTEAQRVPATRAS
ncbi:Gfo/Idh/MocA family protein [Amycolatopsis regifaucium]|uniref:Oxidoreductase n=1 Tax=Amycolatopsis regifaucium TaxID=546365 RepID=A0A154MVM0_9PSEU|nr:Gfo/Idh/MocA family oxidoreductase [Amycolatopsis regifaucium]KZB88346.1 oxidoreductase [Amycolatopsis regifaucium]OKA11457.1 oxidoreductase [Amycolatopsis regifaucium]SFH41322.1 Predicted dehydrogenase [Amycolatopsis regifaucium]